MRTGLEPTPPGSTGQRSTELSYRTKESNSRFVYPNGSRFDSWIVTPAHEKETPMKKLLALPLLIVALTAHAQPDENNNEIETLPMLLQQVRDTLVSVDSTAHEESLPSLSKVTLNLQSALQKDKNGRIKLLFISLGKKVSAELVQTLSIELVPAKELRSEGYGGEGQEPLQISDALSKAILDAARDVKAADFGERKLMLGKLRASIRFALRSTGGGKATIEVLSLEVHGGRHVSQESVQELKLEFAAPSADESPEEGKGNG